MSDQVLARTSDATLVELPARPASKYIVVVSINDCSNQTPYMTTAARHVVGGRAAKAEKRQSSFP